MGIYLNPGNEIFQEISRQPIYVDKSGIISVLNEIMERGNKYMCVSRPRRFGKTVVGNLISSFYSRGCDSHALFDGSIISKSEDYEKYLNKLNVIKLDINYEFQTEKDKENLIDRIEKKVSLELKSAYPQADVDENGSIAGNLAKIWDKTHDTFVIILDEYDVLVRESVEGHISDALFNSYLGFLNGLFKGDTVRPAIALAYLTGILPIVREKIQSKLNNFDEYTMLRPGKLAEFIGFKEEEVKSLCEEYDVDFAECKRWYDGYRLKGFDMYNPRSVVKAMEEGEFASYWSATSTFEVISDYIGMNFDGTKEAVVKMISGGRADVDVTSYKNTMTDFRCADDVFTYLIHLGYLSYDPAEEQCYIPNSEVRREWINAVKISSGYDVTNRIIQESKELLEETIEGNEEAVAQSLDESHINVSSNRTYNNEDSLHSAIYLSYIYALNKYTNIKEMTAGKGFADAVYIPIPAAKNYPALVIELKHNKNVKSAINQIKEKKYSKPLENYSGEILLVGITYDEETKKHTCKIERVEKE